MTGSAHDVSRSGRIPEVDWLMLAVLCLCCLGLTMAVSVPSLSERITPFSELQGQGVKVVAGLVALLTAAFVPLGLLRRCARPLFVLGLLSVLACLAFDTTKGAHRWIVFGSRSFQPVEFARLALVLVTAATIADAGSARREFKQGFVRILAPAGLLAGALALQPDLGNAFLCISLAAGMAIAAGVRVRWFLLVGLPMIPVLALAVLARGYAVGRITSFLSEEPGFQVQRSLTAISSGGMSGVGLGNGWMKLGFVPEARNDFVFAIIGEELGFLGGAFVLVLYSTIGVVGWRLALRMRDPFHRYIVLGCTLAICMQAMVNLLVTTGMAPAKGIDLPLVSSGGTSVVAMLAAVGWIGNAARADSEATTATTTPSSDRRVSA